MIKYYNVDTNRVYVSASFPIDIKNLRLHNGLPPGIKLNLK